MTQTLYAHMNKKKYIYIYILGGKHVQSMLYTCMGLSQ
jgi:hypothetical protein